MTPNDPSQWLVQHEPYMAHIHPTYPRDGRETVHHAYEQYAPTNTVGAYLDAQRRAQERDPALPHDFAAYLAQRVASSHKFWDLNPETPIDDQGHLHAAP